MPFPAREWVSVGASGTLRVAIHLQGKEDAADGGAKGNCHAGCTGCRQQFPHPRLTALKASKEVADDVANAAGNVHRRAFLADAQSRRDGKRLTRVSKRDMSQKMFKLDPGHHHSPK